MALLLRELGERGLLRELESRGLAGPIGDDVAVLGDGLVVTADALVEDVHFRRGWTGWRDLGYKAAAVNLSDLAAAGAEPTALFVVLSAPADLELAAVLEVYSGLNEPGVPVRGGDTVAAESVSVAVTAVGNSERVPGRGGALPGDVLVVTGPLGAAAAGLWVLERGLTGFEELVAAHRRPPLRLAEGKRLAAVAHAMVDLSDGLVIDAGHIAEQSSCAVEIDVELVPKHPRIAELADESLWTRGEDYELLAALTAAAADAMDLPVIGRCLPGSGARLLLGGEPYEARGFEHFSGCGS